ncbi:unnamed protein product, partial [marine sediment metagenome]
HSFKGIGPGDVTMKLRLAQRGQGEHYHVDVGELPSARTAGSLKERSYGESLDVIVGSGVEPPEAALVNPRFPSAVGANEAWRGTLELRNLGAREGYFFYEWLDLSGIVWVPAGVLDLFWIDWFGPIKFTIRWNVAEWTDADTVVTTIGQHTVTGAGGELRNLVISREYVLDGQDWMGSVQVWNIGDTSGNFRVVFTGDITGTSQIFTLGPMEHSTVYLEDIGPKVFTITAQREVDAVWVDDDSRDAKAYNMVSCMSQPYYIGLKHDGDSSRCIGRLEIGDHVFPTSSNVTSYNLAEGKPYWTQMRYMGMPGDGHVIVWLPQHNFPNLIPAYRYRHPHPPE